MSTPPRRVAPPAAVRIVAILAVGACWLSPAATQDPPKQDHVALDLRTADRELLD